MCKLSIWKNSKFYVPALVVVILLFMVSIALLIAGGVESSTSKQFLVQSEVCDDFGNGNLTPFFYHNSCGIPQQKDQILCCPVYQWSDVNDRDYCELRGTCVDITSYYLNNTAKWESIVASHNEKGHYVLIAGGTVFVFCITFFILFHFLNKKAEQLSYQQL